VQWPSVFQLHHIAISFTSGEIRKIVAQDMSSNAEIEAHDIAIILNNMIDVLFAII